MASYYNAAINEYNAFISHSNALISYIDSFDQQYTTYNDQIINNEWDETDRTSDFNSIYNTYFPDSTTFANIQTKITQINANLSAVRTYITQIETAYPSGWVWTTYANYNARGGSFWTDGPNNGWVLQSDYTLEQAKTLVDSEDNVGFIIGDTNTNIFSRYYFRLDDGKNKLEPNANNITYVKTNDVSIRPTEITNYLIDLQTKEQSMSTIIPQFEIRKSEYQVFYNIDPTTFIDLAIEYYNAVSLSNSIVLNLQQYDIKIGDFDSLDYATKSTPGFTDTYLSDIDTLLLNTGNYVNNITTIKNNFIISSTYYYYNTLQSYKLDIESFTSSLSISYTTTNNNHSETIKPIVDFGAYIILLQDHSIATYTYSNSIDLAIKEYYIKERQFIDDSTDETTKSALKTDMNIIVVNVELYLENLQNINNSYKNSIASDSLYYSDYLSYIESYLDTFINQYNNIANNDNAKLYPIFTELIFMYNDFISYSNTTRTDISTFLTNITQFELETDESKRILLDSYKQDILSILEKIQINLQNIYNIEEEFDITRLIYSSFYDEVQTKKLEIQSISDNFTSQYANDVINRYDIFDFFVIYDDFTLQFADATSFYNNAISSIDSISLQIESFCNDVDKLVSAQNLSSDFDILKTHMLNINTIKNHIDITLLTNSTYYPLVVTYKSELETFSNDLSSQFNAILSLNVYELYAAYNEYNNLLVNIQLSDHVIESLITVYTDLNNFETYTELTDSIINNANTGYSLLKTNIDELYRLRELIENNSNNFNMHCVSFNRNLKVYTTDTINIGRLRSTHTNFWLSDEMKIPRFAYDWRIMYTSTSSLNDNDTRASFYVQNLIGNDAIVSPSHDITSYISDHGFVRIGIKNHRYEYDHTAWYAQDGTKLKVLTLQSSNIYNDVVDLYNDPILPDDEALLYNKYRFYPHIGVEQLWKFVSDDNGITFRILSAYRLDQGEQWCISTRPENLGYSDGEYNDGNTRYNAIVSKTPEKWVKFTHESIDPRLIYVGDGFDYQAKISVYNFLEETTYVENINELDAQKIDFNIEKTDYTQLYNTVLDVLGWGKIYYALASYQFYHVNPINLNNFSSALSEYNDVAYSDFVFSIVNRSWHLFSSFKSFHLDNLKTLTVSKTLNQTMSNIQFYYNSVISDIAIVDDALYNAERFYNNAAFSESTLLSDLNEYKDILDESFVNLQFDYNEIYNLHIYKYDDALSYVNIHIQMRTTQSISNDFNVKSDEYLHFYNLLQDELFNDINNADSIISSYRFTFDTLYETINSNITSYENEVYLLNQFIDNMYILNSYYSVFVDTGYNDNFSTSTTKYNEVVSKHNTLLTMKESALDVIAENYRYLTDVQITTLTNYYNTLIESIGSITSVIDLMTISFEELLTLYPTKRAFEIEVLHDIYINEISLLDSVQIIYSEEELINIKNIVSENVEYVSSIQLPNYSEKSVNTQPYRLNSYNNNTLNIIPPNLPNNFIAFLGKWGSTKENSLFVNNTDNSYTLSSMTHEEHIVFENSIGASWSDNFWYPSSEYITYPLSLKTSRTEIRTVIFALKISQYREFNQTILFLGEEGNNTSSACFEITITNGYIGFNGGLEDTSVITTEHQIPLNKWCYICVYEDGNKTIEIYSTVPSINQSEDSFSLISQTYLQNLQDISSELKLIVGSYQVSSENILLDSVINYLSMYSYKLSTVILNNIIRQPCYPPNPNFYQQSFISNTGAYDGYDRIAIDITPLRTTSRTFLFAIMLRNKLSGDMGSILSIGNKSDGTLFSVKITGAGDNDDDIYDNISFVGHGDGNDLKMGLEAETTDIKNAAGGYKSARIREWYWYYCAIMEDGNKKITCYLTSTEYGFRSIPYFEKKFEGTIEGLNDLQDNLYIYIGREIGQSDKLRDAELAYIAYYEQTFTLNELNNIFKYRYVDDIATSISDVISSLPVSTQYVEDILNNQITYINLYNQSTQIYDYVKNYVATLFEIDKLSSNIKDFKDIFDNFESDANIIQTNNQSMYSSILTSSNSFIVHYANIQISDMLDDFSDIKNYTLNIKNNYTNISLIFDNSYQSFSTVSISYNIINVKFDEFYTSPYSSDIIDNYFSLSSTNFNSILNIFNNINTILDDTNIYVIDSENIQTNLSSRIDVENLIYTNIRIIDESFSVTSNIVLLSDIDSYIISNLNFFFENFDVLVSKQSIELRSEEIGLKTNFLYNYANIKFIADYKYLNIDIDFSFINKQLYLTWSHDDITPLYSVFLNDNRHDIPSGDNTLEIDYSITQEIYVSKNNVFNNIVESKKCLIEGIPQLDFSNFEIFNENSSIYAKPIFTELSFAYYDRTSITMNIKDPILYQNINIQKNINDPNKMFIDLSMFSFTVQILIEINISIVLKITSIEEEFIYQYETSQYLLEISKPRIESRYDYIEEYLTDITALITIHNYENLYERLGYIRTHQYTILQFTNALEFYIMLNSLDPFSEDRDPAIDDSTINNSVYLVNKRIPVFKLEFLFSTTNDMFSTNISNIEQKLKSIGYGRLLISNNNTYTNHMCVIDSVESSNYLIISDFDNLNVNGLFRLEKNPLNAVFSIRFRGDKVVNDSERLILIDNNLKHIIWFPVFLSSTTFILTTEDHRQCSVLIQSIGSETNLLVYLIGVDDPEKSNYQQIDFFIHYGSGSAIQFRTNISGNTYTLNVIDSVIILEQSEYLNIYWLIDWYHENDDFEVDIFPTMLDQISLKYITIKYLDDRRLGYNEYSEYYVVLGDNYTLTISDVNTVLMTFMFNGISQIPSLPTEYTLYYDMNDPGAFISFKTHDIDSDEIKLYDLSLTSSKPHVELYSIDVNQNMYSILNEYRIYQLFINDSVIQSALNNTGELTLAIKTMKNNIVSPFAIKGDNTDTLYEDDYTTTIYNYDNSIFTFTLTEFFNNLYLTPINLSDLSDENTQDISTSLIPPSEFGDIQLLVKVSYDQDETATIASTADKSILSITNLADGNQMNVHNSTSGFINTYVKTINFIRKGLFMDYAGISYNIGSYNNGIYNTQPFGATSIVVFSNTHPNIRNNVWKKFSSHGNHGAMFGISRFGGEQKIIIQFAGNSYSNAGEYVDFNFLDITTEINYLVWASVKETETGVYNLTLELWSFSDSSTPPTLVQSVNYTKTFNILTSSSLNKDHYHSGIDRYTDTDEYQYFNQSLSSIIVFESRFYKGCIENSLKDSVLNEMLDYWRCVVLLYQYQPTNVHYIIGSYNENIFGLVLKNEFEFVEKIKATSINVFRLNTHDIDIKIEDTINLGSWSSSNYAIDNVFMGVSKFSNFNKIGLIFNGIERIEYGHTFDFENLQNNTVYLLFMSVVQTTVNSFKIYQQLWSKQEEEDYIILEEFEYTIQEYLNNSVKNSDTYNVSIHEDVVNASYTVLEHYFYKGTFENLTKNQLITTILNKY
jgi:hypothetical protein